MNKQKNHYLFEFDKENKDKYCVNYLIGADEAGRGPAAGGVWASAVCFFENVDIKLFDKLNDSKKISSSTRENLYELIKKNSYYSIKAIKVEKIEEINILQASLLAIKYAINDVISQINNSSNIVLIDGNQLIKNCDFKQMSIIKGDSQSATIAAASILAKVSRDRYMLKLDKSFPQYDWKNNKGYLTKKHIDAIKRFGITEYHRKSFLKNIIKSSQ